MRMMLFRSVLLFAGIAPGAWAGPALDEAKAAYSSENYAEARRLLGEDILLSDPEAILMLAGMTLDGLGGPSDPVAAYALLSEVFMIGEPDLRVTAAGQRNPVAMRLTMDEIRQGETQVVAWVDKTLTPEGRKAEVSRLKELISVCDPAQTECDEIVKDAFALGPAAPELIPAVVDLMTRDPMWMPRETYAATLAMIGTAAVPAMCDVLLDKNELATEGPWNATVITQALGYMGPAAAQARQCLMTALARDYIEVGAGQSEAAPLSEDLKSGGAAEIFLELKAWIANTLIRIGDPEAEIRDQLVNYLNAETDQKTRMVVGWAIGSIYQDFKIAIAIMTSALDSNDERTQLMALYMIDDFANLPDFTDAAAELLPRLSVLAKDANPNLSAAALQTLDFLSE
jgi:hypothetical protein